MVAAHAAEALDKAVSSLPDGACLYFRFGMVFDASMPTGAIMPLKMSPSDQVLNTAELLDIIITFAKEEGFQRGQSGRWKCLLAPLATVNSAFSRAIAEVIWEDVDSLDPFLSLLQPSGRSSQVMVSRRVKRN
jgi:hypothetical protein